MSQFFEYVKMAFQNIKANKGRSLLTMLGIIIGISSVIMIISIGNGVKGSIDEDLNDFMGGQLWVYIDSAKQKDNMLEFTLEDFEAIKEKIPHVKTVTPEYYMYGSARGSKQNDIDATIKSGTAGYEFVTPEPIIKGSYYTDADVESCEPVCILNESGAKQLFGTTENIIGMPVSATIYGRSVELRVKGIRKDSSSAILNALTGANSRISIEAPYTIMSNIGFYVEGFDGFYIISDSPQYSQDIYKATVSLLEARYNVRGQSCFLLQDLGQEADSITGILDYITIFVVFVAAISLLVGGIGVMNIMLVSVTERTREIGIRKALGAKTEAIMTQFLSEAAIITLVGGIIGILLGIGGGTGICSILNALGAFENCKPMVTVPTVVIATLFSSGVGLFFGIYPAKKAAKLNPIEALRHE